MKKLIVGILVSAVFVYFSLRGLEYEKIRASMEGVRYAYLVPVVLLYVFISFLRSLRWGLIISPIRHIGQRSLYPMTCVGFMSVVLVPMRMGEFVRPYLLSAKDLVPFGSGLATVFVERVLDVLSVMGIFFLVVLNSDLPPWLTKSGYMALGAFGVLIAAMLLLYFRTEAVLRLVSPAFRVLPRRFHDKVDLLICRFVEGFGIISSPGRLLGSMVLSLAIWGLTGLTIYTLFSFSNIDLPLIVAFVVMVITIVGISLPTAPGMMGNFQYACIVALTWFGVEKGPAFFFSMVYYIMGIGTMIILGLVFLPVVDVPLMGALRNIKKGLGKTEAPE